MNKEDKERISAAVFLLELELNRGSWSEDECVDKLVKFAKRSENVEDLE